MLLEKEARPAPSSIPIASSLALPSTQTNEEWIEGFSKWLKRKYPHSSTPLHYANDAKLIFGWLKKPALEVRVKDIDGYIQHSQGSGHSIATINRRLATLRVFYDWLSFELDTLVTHPVIPRRHFIRVGERLPRDVREADLKTLFSTIASVRDRAMFALMLRCGLRVGEIHALSLQDIEQPIKQTGDSLPRLRVRGKGNKERTAYLSAQANAALQAWLKMRPQVEGDAVFINQHGKRLSVNGIQFILGQVCKRAGLHITCHQFRHTFGRHMAESGVPVTSIQRLMGHHWLQSTEVYLHVSDPRLQADYQAAMHTIADQLDLVISQDDGDDGTAAPQKAKGGAA
jgi:site-specific recombinase XerD